MAEIERNPLAVRQGAAAVACIAAAAVAMPVISHRAAEQRENAAWAARNAPVGIQFTQSVREPNARIELTSYRMTDGLRARGTAALFESPSAHAMLVEAALRGPMAPATTEPVVPQLDPRQVNCMAEAVYYEARGEDYEGQVAVAEVVMNRTRSRFFPKTVCGVVYQGADRDTGCQFTFTCDGSIHQRPHGAAWARAQIVAAQEMQGFARTVTQHATHYHNDTVNPIWASSMVRTTRIGDHTFYRFPNSSERAVLEEAALRRRAATAHGDSDQLIPPADEAAQAAQAVANGQHAAADQSGASASAHTSTDVGA